jgi:hypothetical protein
MARFLGARNLCGSPGGSRNSQAAVGLTGVALAAIQGHTRAETAASYADATLLTTAFGV